MEVKRIVAGILGTNSYLLSNDDFAIYIDPAGKDDKMALELGDKKLIGILLTHGHFDHIKAVDGLAKKYGAPIYINKEDEYLVRDKAQARSFGILNSPHISSKLNYYEEGINKIGPFEFEVIFTPGHTKGSVCLRFGKDLFTGDTLFKGAVGRTDLDGGDESELKASLRILTNIKENLNIYPGHEDISTLDEEKMNNYYLR